jgi:YVTN family beta-propeller protein
VINGRTNAVVATFFGSHAGAFFLSVNSRTDRIYLANGNLFVAVISGRTNTRMARIRVLGEPGGTAVNQQTNIIYASNASDGDLSVINGETNKVTAQIPVASNSGGFGLIAVAVNQQSNVIYTTSQIDTVFAINGRTNTISGSIRLDARGIAVNPSTGTIYTAGFAQQANEVSALSSTCP